MNITDYIKKLQEKTDLSHDQINSIMSEIFSGNITTEQITDFLGSLADKGETDEELLGMLEKMQELSLKVQTGNILSKIQMQP